ncbi:MAG: dipeptidase [Acidobacteriota bacterium]|nr:dipeptidase [Acidobacteriota bacterium]
MKKLVFLFFLLAFSAMLAKAQTMPAGADPNLWQRALQIHKRAIIVDGHNDITSPMVDEDFDIGSDSRGKFHRDGGDPFHTDIARLKQSGLTGLFFSIYVDRRFAEQPEKGSARRALDLIDATYRAVERYPDTFLFATTSADIRRAKREGKIAALMGIEGGHAIENSLFALRNFYRLGVRYMTLTHNNTNDWADSNWVDQGREKSRHNGLSDFGKEVVREMNRLGMLVDVSHVSNKTLSDVLDITTAPVIASHSSAQALAMHSRNINDDLLRRIGKNGGVVMVNFYSAFISQKYLDDTRARDKRLEPELNRLRDKYKDNKREFEAEREKLLVANPVHPPSYTVVVDHIDHIRKVAGIDSVGIGSDFDGVDSLPEGLTGVESLPLITYEMLRRGYSEQDIRKVLGENFLRAFAQAERVANISTRKISGEGSLKRIGK